MKALLLAVLVVAAGPILLSFIILGFALGVAYDGARKGFWIWRECLLSMRSRFAAELKVRP